MTNKIRYHDHHPVRFALTLSEKQKELLEKIALHRNANMSAALRQMILDEGNWIIDPDDVKADDELRAIFEEQERISPYAKLVGAIFGLRGILVRDVADIESTVGALSKIQREVIYMRFGINGAAYTLRDVGNVLGVSPERIRQIEAKALRRLRHPFRSRKILSYIVAEVHITPEEAAELRDDLFASRAEATVLKNEILTLRETLSVMQAELDVALLVANTAAKALDWEGDLKSITGALEDLGLSVRAYNCLKRSGLTTVAEVIHILRQGDEGDRKLLCTRNLGEGILAEIKSKSREYLSHLKEKTQ